MGEVGEVQRFRNVTDGVIGAVAINEEGKREGIPVKPGETVELSEQEQQLTARAPRSPADNPLVGGGPDGGPALVPVEAGDDRPLRPEPAAEPEPEPDLGPSDPEETDQTEAGPKSDETAAAPQGPAAEGSFAPGEQVGTPDAPAAA